mmetsp:Transcript_1666/g.6556  ORF Transcript_1666/g.6556 Transcript_1666/m.6556 type:complete len:212 (+) Transcript_1666:406-1041(+)
MRCPDDDHRHLRHCASGQQGGAVGPVHGLRGRFRVGGRARLHPDQPLGRPDLPLLQRPRRRRALQRGPAAAAGCRPCRRRGGRRLAAGDEAHSELVHRQAWLHRRHRGHHHQPSSGLEPLERGPRRWLGLQLRLWRLLRAALPASRLRRCGLHLSRRPPHRGATLALRCRCAQGGAHIPDAPSDFGLRQAVAGYSDPHEFLKSCIGGLRKS